MEKQLLTLQKFVTVRLANNNGMTADDVRTLSVMVVSLTDAWERCDAAREGTRGDGEQQ